MSKENRPPRKKSPSFVKGKLVEHVVATLYDGENIQVEKNARFPAVDNSTRKREIDVLITHLNNSSNKYTIIECKNYNKIIDAPLIDAFVGKLDDIGIPTQSGIFVSVKGFTEGAIQRATKAGIKTLVVTGLSEDRLSTETKNALQFIIFLSPMIKSISIHTPNELSPDFNSTPFLYSASRKIKGSIFDFFWKKWVEGKLETDIGEHKIKIDLPDDYYVPSGEKLDLLQKVTSIEAVLQITGLIMIATGISKEHFLINQTNKNIERFSKDAIFTKPTGIQKILSFQTEKDLQEFIYNQKATIKITPGRNKLPRIKAFSIYWPISKRAFSELAKSYNSYLNGEVSEFNIEKLTHIEGSDLKTAWEPIWDENPILLNK